MGEGFDADGVPARCDGCGRYSTGSRMKQAGWAVRRDAAGFAGAYCLDCAEALHLLPSLLRCAECGQPVANDERAERNGWRYWSDGVGELHPYCPSCAAREFDQAAP